MKDESPTGIQLILEERNRQIAQEGYSFEHDDEHTRGELAAAASCYGRSILDTMAHKQKDNFHQWLGLLRMKIGNPKIKFLI